jgi:hypothetical protein
MGLWMFNYGKCGFSMKGCKNNIIAKLRKYEK